MALYLFHGTYTAEAAKAFITNPTDRKEVVRQLFKSAGGELHEMYLSLGDGLDYFAIGDLPDGKSALSSCMQVIAGGSVTCRTFPLFSTAEAAEAMKSAKAMTYRAPTG